MIRSKKNKNKIPSNSSVFHKKVSCSATVEAALATPFFLIALVTLVYLFEILSTQTAIRDGLQYAEKTISEEGYIKRMVSPGKLEQSVTAAIGSDRLSRSMIQGGISCKNSYLSPLTGIGKVEASYRIRIPVPFFSLYSSEMTESMMCKLWCGYEKGGLKKDEDEIVYITETGVVYHLDYNCSYLDLSIKTMNGGNLSAARNKSGGKYHACEYCHPSSKGLVYVTDYGDRYHSSLSCSGLKRTVYSVPKSEAIGKGACSKCAK
ncbi:MAG: pilus assembly protein [Dorea sp.]|nr:pilus assembly protein [Dorea sp.]